MNVVPASSERWADIETLFGEKGGYSGCWCMFWRLPRKDFKQKKGAGTKREHKKQLAQGSVTGVIGYVDGQPAGWCSIGRGKPTLPWKIRAFSSAWTKRRSGQ